jgi:hypothetical protein
LKNRQYNGQKNRNKRRWSRALRKRMLFMTH